MSLYRSFVTPKKAVERPNQTPARPQWLGHPLPQVSTCAAAAAVLCAGPLQVLEEGDCRKLGMGLFLGVAQGSDEPLRFIHLTYTPEGHVSHKASGCGYGDGRAGMVAAVAAHAALQEAPGGRHGWMLMHATCDRQSHCTLTLCCCAVAATHNCVVVLLCLAGCTCGQGSHI